MMLPLLQSVAATPSPSPSSAPSSFGNINITFSFLLSFLTWAPLLVAVAVSVIPEAPRRRATRRLWLIVFWTNLVLLAVTLVIYSSQFNIYGSGLQFEELLPWMPSLGVSYHMGLTGIGMSMLVLSGLIGLAATLAAFDLHDRARSFYVLLLLAQGFINGAIGAQDLVLLLCFWTASMVPIALLVGGWSGPRRWQSAGRLVGYWMLGSAALLVAGLLLWVGIGERSFELPTLADAAPNWKVQLVVALLIIVAAGSRLALVPLHGWAREVLAEAHPAVAVLVMGSAARLGGDLLLQMFAGLNAGGAHLAAKVLMVVAVATVVYAAVAAFRTREIRRLAAYLCLIPSGVMAMGVAALSPMAIAGAAFSLFAGGLAAALLVGAAATLAERAQSSSLLVVMGVATRGPRVVWLLLAGTLAAIGLPFFATFPGLLMVMFGSLQNEPVGTLVMAGGLVLAAAAIAWLLRRALFGRPNTDAPPPSDATMPQAWYLGILIAVLLWVGLIPSGPKLAGNVIFDPGMINVITQETTTISAPYVPPASTSASSTP